ncbi:hypothetical protein BST27_22260 [Mycobacterium intermedium]|uniref:Uncharacterized protein n=2 Tax=Mycobacterium intermedium TaxID=28445 RepID=A0A1E3SAH9_MYCIE|nr:hypothetical protein BHQ20_19100 [Mycobacterium intermedium]OPE49155.1 hypothetical protein BV508_15385 [Mycobacterium intermedium]ORA97504.1 hypothetical protein BST27_22260 [Mycobacterium intermedium]
MLVGSIRWVMTPPEHFTEQELKPRSDWVSERAGGRDGRRRLVLLIVLGESSLTSPAAMS